MKQHISLSIKDFKCIIDALQFTSDSNSLVLCINSTDGEVYFKLIYEETTISTYNINESVIIDCTDITLMFAYKNICDILDKTDSGNIKFILDGKKIEMIITTTFSIHTTLLNNVNDQLLGTLEIPESFVRIDSTIFKNILRYFIRPTKNLSNYFMVNYVYIIATNSLLTIKNEKIKIDLKIDCDTNIDTCKLHIDALYNFIQNKMYNLDIYMSKEFPIICKTNTEMGTIQLYSSPIFD